MREDLIAELRELCAIKGRPLTVGERARTKIAMSEAAAALEAAREDGEEVARWRFVRTLGKLPVRCSTGYYYEDGVLHPTLNEAIDQARGKGVADEA